MSILNIDVKNLSKQEIKALIKECDKLKEKLSKQLMNNTTGFKEQFEHWLAYGEKKDVKYATWIDDNLSDFIDKNIVKSRYETINADKVLEKIKDRVKNKDLSQAKAKKLKQIMMDENFGSVIWDW